MARTFNTAGPCNPADHYMLPPERRLPRVQELVAQGHYFVVHAPRQSGKTTLFRSFAERLTAEGEVAALLVSCERAQAAGGDVDRGVEAILRTIEQRAERLPPELRPPRVEEALHVGGESALAFYLARWAEGCPRPLVLFLDEIDALLDATLISVLRQLREGFAERPAHFPAALALIGLRDVRDYRLEDRPESAHLGTASPFNVKVESLRLPNFEPAEVIELLGQHQAETGQAFEAEARLKVWELTGGQPWLVNALAREAVEVLAPEPGQKIGVEIVEAAQQRLILRRETHLDSLVERLREPRVRKIIEPILAGQLLDPDPWHGDLEYVQDLGLVAAGPQGVRIANKIYQEIIPRALGAMVESSLPSFEGPFVTAEGRLDEEKLLAEFRHFWNENAEFFLERSPYSEAAAQIVFMAFLQRIVNGGGQVDREYGVGRGRIDLLVRWPSPAGQQRWAIELKVWREGQRDPLPESKAQLVAYLERLSLGEGTLVIFDLRRKTEPGVAREWVEDVRVKRLRILVL
jgi:hypothetical protein